jgi:hypothetical protein
MKSKSKIDRAIAVTTQPCGTATEKYNCGHNHVAVMKNSPSWATATDVQKAGGDWDAASTNLEASTSLIADLQAQLDKARANQAIMIRRWAVMKRACLDAVTAYCDGSRDLVLAFGLGVLTHEVFPPAGVPLNLRHKHSKVHGVASATWDPASPKHVLLHMVQYAADPANPATYSAPIPVSRTTFKLAAQTPGAMVHVRVATIDPKLPTGQSDYTAWVPVMVGA